jgi:hypothetical protein
MDETEDKQIDLEELIEEAGQKKKINITVSESTMRQLESLGITPEELAKAIKKTIQDK